MRTNEQFKQEIIKRAEKYKKERLKKRKKIICSFSVAVVCITAFAAAIPAVSLKAQKNSDSANSSADSSSTLILSEDAAKASPLYGNTEIAAEIGGTGKTENAENRYFAEIITGEMASYSDDKNLVSAIYTAVNNIPETADTKESAYKSVTNGEIYEITIVYEGVENKYSFNGCAVKKGESDWIYISESAAKELNAAIDKII